MIVPKVWEAFHNIWFSFALLLLLSFSFKITIITAGNFGALAASLVFLTLLLSVLYAVIYATTGTGRQF